MKISSCVCVKKKVNRILIHFHPELGFLFSIVCELGFHVNLRCSG